MGSNIHVHRSCENHAKTPAAHLFTDEQHGLGLLGDRLDQERRPHVVNIGNQDGGVLGGTVGRVVVLVNTSTPVLPLTCDVKRRLIYM